MKTINFKREINSTLEAAVDSITQALKSEDFGILTRIDLHTKIKEKLGKEVIPTVILGACNPGIAYESYQANSDIASLLPCNAVLREIAPGRISIELAKPTALMEILGDQKLVDQACSADLKLKKALDSLS